MLHISSTGASALRLAALVALCSALYFPNLGKIPFFNKGEPREALVVQEMVRYGNWFFPLKRGEEVPSKPPLFHWLAALASAAWGRVSEATVRFPSALLATLSVLLLYGFGRQLFDEEIGFWAGVMLATSAGYQSEAIAARVDMTLTFFMTVILVAFYFLYGGFLKGSWWFYGFYFLSGVAALAKGPVGLILPGMVICSFLMVTKRWDFLARLCFHKGVILALLVPASWYGFALVVGGDEFVSRQIIHENLARFFVSGEGGSGHQKPIYYYLPYLVLEGLPWTLFLPFAVADWLKGKTLARGHALFLALWAGLIFLFFSVSAGKRSVYILPLYPPLFLLIAAWLSQAQGSRNRAVGLRCVGALALVLGLGVLMVAGMDFLGGSGFSWLFSQVEAVVKPKDQAYLAIVQTAVAGAGRLFLPLLALSALFWVAAGCFLFAVNHRAAAAALALLSLLLGVALQGAVMPAIADARSYRTFMDEVNRRMGQGMPLTLYGAGWDLTSVVFYRGERVPVHRGDLVSLAQRMRQFRGYYLMGEREWEQLKGSAGDGFSLELRSRGTGPDGNEPIVLIRSVETGKG